MPSKFIHFAINAEDTERGRRFYEKGFGWKFEEWGPPGFFKIDMRAGPPVHVIEWRASRDGSKRHPGSGPPVVLLKIPRAMLRAPSNFETN